MKEKDYMFKTIEDVVNELKNLPFGQSIDFTFDDPDDEDEYFAPSDWYGVKIMNLFDEPYGVLCFGYYGGSGIRIEEIEDSTEILEKLKTFCYDEMDREVNVLCVSKKCNGE